LEQFTVNKPKPNTPEYLDIRECTIVPCRQIIMFKYPLGHEGAETIAERRSIEEGLTRIN